MIKRLTFLFSFAFIFILFSAWGFYGHRRINRMAVFTLPPEMIGFYKAHIDYITTHSIDPDKRRYASEEEAPKHYIDIDYYAKNGENPFELMPRKWQDAVNKYTEDTLKAYGIVPWHISSMMTWLTNAFAERDANKILYLSADLGHYLADAHVPLHTTVNYNGQLTDQKGIHGLWESRIPELMADEYDYLVGRAIYIKQPLSKTWDILEKSHSYLDSVLLIEKDLSKRFPSDQKYVMEDRGSSTVRQYSHGYASTYSKRMGDMVESRMRNAISMVGSYWYTAWVNAGQPDLNFIKDKVNMEAIAEKEEEEATKAEGQKIKGRAHE